MELSFISFCLSLFLFGFGGGLIVGKLLSRPRGFEQMSYKGTPMYADPDMKPGIMEIRKEPSFPQPKKKPTLSRVMKNPTPEEIQKRRDKEAMDDQVESLQYDPRDKGTIVL